MTESRIAEKTYDDRCSSYLFLVAVASNDGENVDVHFGRAESFLIYGVKEDDETEFLEKRKADPVCRGGFHMQEDMKNSAGRLSDCEYVLASKIGEGAAMVLEGMGICPMELPGNIEDAIDRVIMYRKVEKLFE